MDEYQRDFVQESEENITELNNALLELERDPADDAAMDRIFRMAHTLKGNAGAMGFQPASNLAHAIEDLLEAVRSGRIDVTPGLMDEIFAGVDELETMVDEVRAYGEIRTDPSDTIETIREVQQEATGVPTIGEPSDESIEEAVSDAADLTDEAHDVFHVRLAVDESGSVAHGSAVVDALADAFDLLGTVPAEETIADGDYDGTFDAVFGSAVGEAAISAALDPVDAVAQARINEVTDTYDASRAEPEPDESGDDEFDDLFDDDEPGSTIDVDAAQDMSVDDLLSEFDEYDDLDAMVEEMDDVSGFDDLGDAGSFDDLDIGGDLAGDEPIADPLDDEDVGELDDDRSFEDDGDEAAEPVEDPDDEVDDAAATFAELKQEVDPVGFDELQDELDELEFDEYADEEEVGFDELLGDDFEESEDDFFGGDTEAAVGTDQDEVSVDDLVSDEDIAGFEESAAETPVEPDDPVEPTASDTAEAADDGVEDIDDVAAAADDVDADADVATADADAEADAADSDVIADADAADPSVEGDAVDAVESTDARDETAESVDAAEESAVEDDTDVVEPDVTADAADATDEPTVDTDDDFATPAAETDDGFGAGAFDDADTGFDDTADFGGEEFELDAADPDAPSTVDDAPEGSFEDDSFDDEFDDDAFPDDAASDDDGFDGPEPTDASPMDETSVTADASGDDEDLDRVEVQQFELDEPEAATETTTEVETGDFGTDADADDGTAAPSTSSYGDFSDVDVDGADGFDPAPEPAASADEAGDTAADDGVEVSALDVDVDIQTLADEDVESEGDEEIQSIRVDVEQVDRLLNLVEGLVTSRVRLRRTAEEGADPAELDDELDELEDLTGELQDTVMDVRLVPVQMVANRLPRIVRDISREQDKEVEFEMHGEGVEVDRSILDRIGDPLVHIVRNAVDHGIEAPDDREAAGKPRTGQVSLEVERARDQVVIEVSDDGSGLDADRLREAAVEADVLDEDEAAELSDEEAHELIFHPGLSTATEVTDVSGRGVGMDVVRSTVTDLDGSVSVESDPGEGTTIRMLLPVTVAIADVMFVTSGDEEFGVPVKDIQDIGDAAEITVEDGQEVVRAGDRSYPLVRLNEALETPGRARNGDGMLLRIRDEVRPVAVHCDEVRGQQEVVVKPFEGVLGGIPGLSGATVLGEGEVVNILDVKTL